MQISPRSTCRNISRQPDSRSSRCPSIIRRSRRSSVSEYRRVTEIPGNIDLVDVFRRSDDINGHVEEMLAKRPMAVWFQSGIRNDAAAETLAKADIKVVQDRCLMVEHRRVATK